MKTLFLIFLLVTAAFFMGVAILAFIGFVKARRDAGKTDDDMVKTMISTIIFWMIGGIFLAFAYLVS